MPVTRRKFVQHLGIAALGAPFMERLARAAPQTPFPFVDGLTLADALEDLPASGLSAFVLDASSAGPLRTADGSIKYWRTFEACSKSIADMRHMLSTSQQAFLATRSSDISEAYRTKRTAVYFQFQGGGEAVGENLERLEFFHQKGLRIFQITHHNNNSWGGGAIERTWSGLTKIGHDGVERLNALGMIPDLAHVSDPTSRDVLKASTKPVIISHGGARAIVNNARCAPDDVIKGVADSGGVMGVFMMSCWLTNDPVPTIDSYLAQIKHIIKVGGIDAVGIANDYPIGGNPAAHAVSNDNAKAVKTILTWWNSVAKEQVLGFETLPKHVVIPELNNPRRAFLIHDALGRARYSSAEVEKIMGGNWIRVLKESLS